MRFALGLLLVLAGLLLPGGAGAHEVRPAFLQIDETAPDQYRVLWKVPRIDLRAPDITPRFAPGLTLEERGEPLLVDGFVVYHYQLHGEGGLAGTPLAIDGLAQTTIDVLVDVRLADGSRHGFLLRPAAGRVDIPLAPTRWGVASGYLKLGVEHILLGIDHLLFVLALILITRGMGRIVETVTAFTVAHSITLSLAALGYVDVPGPPVEATIALSIVFLALEILRTQAGHPTLTSRKPWLVAFTFGLLHGLGFAGALADIGLPQTEIPLALAAFNIGVELGQLAFVAVVLLVAGWVRRRRDWPMALRRLPAYAIGTVSMFWVVERLWAFGG